MKNTTLFSLDGKIALITGGARGLGFTMARGLAEAGAQIFFNATSLESVDKGISAFKKWNIEANGFVCDVTKELMIKEMVSTIEEKYGAIDILVNNAGVINRTPMLEMQLDEFRHVIDVDLIAPFMVAKAVLPTMVKRRYGKIINICGIMSEVGRETASAYASAKGGLKMLTRNIASEFGSFNIQCNGIGPGYMATSLNSQLRETLPDGSKHPFDKFISSRTPAGRWGNSEDLIGPVIFLASEASDFINGQILYVDGGFLTYLGKPAVD